jgi:hypothetical protein
MSYYCTFLLVLKWPSQAWYFKVFQYVHIRVDCRVMVEVGSKFLMWQSLVWVSLAIVGVFLWVSSTDMLHVCMLKIFSNCLPLVCTCLSRHSLMALNIAHTSWGGHECGALVVGSLWNNKNGMRVYHWVKTSCKITSTWERGNDTCPIAMVCKQVRKNISCVLATSTAFLCILECFREGYCELWETCRSNSLQNCGIHFIGL